MKYLVIFEDGQMGQVEEIQLCDTESVEDGLMDIVKYEDGEFLQCGGEGEWAVVPGTKTGPDES